MTLPRLPWSLPHVLEIGKRVRVLFGATIIVDTKSPKLVWEHDRYPAYFFNKEDVPSQCLDAPQQTQDGTTVYDVLRGPFRAEKAATLFHKPEALSGLVKIRFDAMHAWFEEDEQIFVHPKDPYKRVDVLQSSRHVRVEIDGVEVANTTRARLLYETGLPVRTYIPKTDCKLQYFRPSSLTTQCPYKGVASYYNVQLSPDRVVENVVWWYRNANLECATINGFAAFYDEKVDVWVDGVKQSRP